MKLQDVCELFTDGDWIESKDQSDEGIRLVQTGNIGIGKYLEKEGKEKYISKDTFKSLNCTEIYPGDVLISRLPEPVGRGCIIPEKNERMITAVDCTICRVNEKIVDKKYFCYYLQSPTYYNQLEQSVTGTTRKRISRKNLGNVEMSIPEKEKQIEIINVLDKVTTLIEERKEELQKLDELIKARFIELFGNPVLNPIGWPVKRLGDITTKIGSGATPKGGKESYREDGISLIRSMNVHNGKFEYKDLAHISDEQAERLDNVTLEMDDVLLNITGASVARCCIVPADVLPARVNQHVCIVRCKEFISPEFLNCLLIEDNYQDLLWGIAGSGATREAITKQQVEDLQIIIPPETMQREFTTFVKQIDKSKVAVQKALEEAQLLFDSLMQKYFG